MYLYALITYKTDNMAYKIIDLEGIGPVYAEKLVAAGVVTADDLLEKCAAPKGRKELAEIGRAHV